MAKTKALFLDALGTWDGAGELRTLCESKFDWECLQISHEATQTDWKNALRRLDEYIASADVLVFLGNYALFSWLGDHGDSYIDQIIEKMKAGTPFFFQCSRLHSQLQSGQAPSCFNRLLGHCEVTSTEHRVYSLVDAYDGHTSDTACWFRKGDDCFLNPDIFIDVESVLLTQANLLHYDGNTYPIIETGPLHLFANAGDLPSEGILGKKNAVAVMRRTEKETGIIMGGSALSSAAATMGGELPGIEVNRKMALSIMSLLDRSVRKTLNLREAYSAFYKLEGDLGNLISSVLEPRSTSGGIEQFFPERVTEHICSERGCDFSLANYNDLVDIVLGNWDVFAPAFGNPSKTKIKSSFQKLNYTHRRYFAHPHKAEQEGRQFDREDVEEIRAVHELVRQAFRDCTLQTD